MKKSTVSAVAVAIGLAVTAYPAMAKQEGKTKGKSTERATKENSARQAGELPSGLQKRSEKKGELPSGLQKKQDEDGLPKGLTTGGKKLESSTKNTKSLK